MSASGDNTGERRIDRRERRLKNILCWAFPTVACAFRPQGYQLLGGSRMKRHGGVEIGFGGAHFNRDGGHLDHFGGALPHDMAAGNAVGRAVDHKLDQDGGVAPGQG
jgi:hypothetical protein